MDYFKERSFKEMLENKCSQVFGISGKEASVDQMYKAVSLTINDILRAKRRNYNALVREKKAKRVYYLSMEFLMGKSLKNNLNNLCILDTVSETLASYGITLDDLYECEPDAALGNGGLGRLGACYLDSLASLDYPAMGFSIRYEYGLFKQKIIDCYQTELPDVWLPGGEVWLAKREDKIFNVKFDGCVEGKMVNGKKVYDYKGYSEIEAIPYDMMVSGGNDSEAISVLRLWRSRNIKNFDLNSFTNGDYLKATLEYNDADLISKVLYPSDNHYQGKTLRLKQQYFLCSASAQNIVTDHLRYYGDINTIDKYAVIHINDTHPTLVIPELIRILMDDHGFAFDDAWEKVKKMVNYTNHTVLAEALEKWNEDLVSKKIPRIYIILKQINERVKAEMECSGLHDKELEDLLVIANGEVRMANLCCLASGKVNGVSALHSDIIKNELFSGYNKLFPNKFLSVTNGIAYRRWLCASNPELASYLDKLIGPEYRYDAKYLEKLLAYKDDENVLNDLAKIKYNNKCIFAKYLYSKFGIIVDPTTRFDVQAKRLHEYKRQLLNVLKIIALITDLELDPMRDVTPQTYIFGAKAASTYYIAKDIINLINCISADIQKRPEIRSKVNVVFVEDYNVSTAEVLIPATDVSEQISLAGKEASGTGNMKFMINGAITYGTLDGANVEINEQVGDENMFLFGMHADEAKDTWNHGYTAKYYYDNNFIIKRVLDRLDQGFNGKSFGNIKHYLLDQYPVADPYMCLKDFDSYMKVYYDMDKAYKDRNRWNKMSLVNIAKAGIFSSDRAINEYASKIWDLKKIK